MALAGRGSDVGSIRASNDAVAALRSGDPSRPHLALVAVRGEANGGGLRSASLVDASGRVPFDPYGRWTGPFAPERNDVLFGVRPSVEGRCLAHRAKGGDHRARQEVTVAPEVAEQALVLARTCGAAGMAMCARAAAGVPSRLPGFEASGPTWPPQQLARRFARLPGVVTTERRAPVEGERGSA